MKVIKKSDIVLVCPCCQAVLKVDPSDIIKFDGKAYVKCPCCQYHTRLYTQTKDEIIYNNNIYMKIGDVEFKPRNDK